MIRTWADFVLQTRKASVLDAALVASLSGVKRTKHFPEGMELYLSSELPRDQTTLLAVLLDVFRGLQTMLGFISGESWRTGTSYV